MMTARLLTQLVFSVPADRLAHQALASAPTAGKLLAAALALTSVPTTTIAEAVVKWCVTAVSLL